MAEYFEREALIGDLTAAMDHRGMGQVIGQTLIRYVKRQPAADVAPVVHGKWIKGPSNPYCSECFVECRDETPFCPNCGAMMDGGTT